MAYTKQQLSSKNSTYKKYKYNTNQLNINQYNHFMCKQVS